MWLFRNAWAASATVPDGSCSQLAFLIFFTQLAFGSRPLRSIKSRIQQLHIGCLQSLLALGDLVFHLLALV